MPEAAQINIQPGDRWFGLAEACHYAKLGEKRLKELALAGKVLGYPDPEDRRGGKKSMGRWIFDRESLDAYRLALCGQQEVMQALIATRGKLGL